jgi:outer membrane receptor protein involved in Fe transport
MNSSIREFKLLPLNRAIALVTLTSIASANVISQESSDNELLDPARLEEIIVTATKREENMQDLPQSIQAFSTEDIKTLGFSNMREYKKAIPSLSTVQNSPGRSEVVFRGVSTGSGEWRTDSGTAVYLGDIPMTSATQAVDPRLVDIQRVEALPGPQGTLFGSSSQSGALRIIPNKPDHSSAYGEINTGFSTINKGDKSHYVEAYANTPIIDDKLTIRTVVFDSKDGGYIDNVFGTNIFSDDDNSDVVEKDFNEWDQKGARVTALWSVNDSWDVSLMVMQQDQRSKGDWMSDPGAPGLDDLEIVRFHKDDRRDKWWISALNVTGDLGFAELSVTSSYLDREITYEFDANIDGQIRAQSVVTYGTYIYYNVLYDTGFQPETYVNDQTAERHTHEIRLSSLGDSRLKWMVGAFYEKTEDYWDYVFARVENLDSTPFGAYWGLAYETYLPNTDDWYTEEYNSKTEQKAVFGEMSYGLTDKLTATIGARWFEYERDRTEFKEWPRGNPYDTDIYEGDDSDTLYKFAVNYDITDDQMIYALYSEGFRLGGANSKKNPASRMPDRYENDSLINKEVGLKSQWLDNRLQLNASFYTMEWDDIQRGITDPDDWSANATINMGDAELSGTEISATFIVSERLSLDASYATNDSELQNDYYLSEVISLTDPESQDWLLGANGQEMAIAPPSKWWVGIEYTMPELMEGIDGWIRYDHWWQEAMYHDWWSARDAMNSDPTVNGSKLIKDQGEANLQFGVYSGNDWSATLSIWNIWDDRNAQWIASWYDDNFGENGTWPEVDRYLNMPSYNQPRTIQISFTKTFGQ